MWTCIGYYSHMLTAKIAHLCKRAAVRECVPFFVPMIVTNGLWSVMRMKLRINGEII